MKKAVVRASIDLGSSYFRLLVVEGRLRPGGAFSVETTLEDKRFVGWGKDIQTSHSISRDRLLVAERALVELVRTARQSGCDAPVLVGTNVLRTARNARAAVLRLRRAVSLPVRVLSPWGEAAKGFLGSAASMPKALPTVLLDLGGTSTEISWGIDGRIQDYASIPLGTHRVAHWLGTLQRQRMRVSNITAVARQRFDRLLGGVPRIAEVSRLCRWREIPTILATGGTAVSLAVLKRFMAGHAPRFSEREALSADGLVLIGRRLAGMFAGRREGRIPLDSGRRGLIVPGLLLIRMLSERMGMDCFFTTARDLRWGVVLSNGRFEENEILGGGSDVHEQAGIDSR